MRIICYVLKYSRYIIVQMQHQQNVLYILSYCYFSFSNLLTLIVGIVEYISVLLFTLYYRIDCYHSDIWLDESKLDCITLPMCSINKNSIQSNTKILNNVDVVYIVPHIPSLFPVSQFCINLIHDLFSSTK